MHNLTRLALLMAVMGIGCHSDNLVRDRMKDPDGQGQIVRFRGPVRLSLTAVQVAPAKSSGLQWDGPGRLTDKEMKALTPPPKSALFKALLGVATGHPGALALGGLEPFANKIIAGMEAPDVQVVISLNGQPLVTAPKIANSYTPTWTGIYTEPVSIGDFDNIEVHATDVDVLADDDIGGCTIRGMPYVNDKGYATAQSFECHSQLLAVALQVSPVQAVKK